MTAPDTAIIDSPYVGPRAFDEADQLLFFGRDDENRQLAALVIAHRAVLLYAQSGAGKTSLLQAGLVPAFKKRNRIVSLPIGRVSGETPDSVANSFVYNALVNIYGRDARPAELASLSLSQGLAPFISEAGNGRRPRPRLLILDQFEELFTSHAGRYEERSDFFAQLQACLETFPTLSLLLSMREDYIAHLDAYAGQLPDRLRTRFRLERLGPEAALRAVVDPLARTDRLYAPGVAEELVDNLRRVRRRVMTGSGSETTEVLGRYVEPVHLQIVCRQLWEGMPDDDLQIDLEDVQQFGDVDQALTDFYEGALKAALPLAGMGERRLRQWFDTRLITPSQTRGLLFRGETETAGLPNAAVDALVDEWLVRADIRGGETWNELSHDRLVEPILNANRAWRDRHANPLAAALEAWQASGELSLGSQLLELEAYAAAQPDDITGEEQSFLKASRGEQDRRDRLAAQRNTRRVIMGASVIGAIMLALLVWALFSADSAQDAQATAQVDRAAAVAAQSAAEILQVTAEADALLQADLRVEADNKAATAAAAEATASAARILAEAKEREADAERAAAEAAEAQARELKTQIQASQLAAASQAELNRDAELGLLLATAGLGLRRQVDTEARFYDAIFAPFRGTLRGHANWVRSAAFSPDGTLIVTAGADDTARVWATETGEELAVLDGHKESVRSAAFSPDGTLIVTAGCDETDNFECVAGTARVYETGTGEELAVLVGHVDEATSAVFSPDGERIVTVSQDGTARVWETETGEEVAVLGHGGWVNSAAFGPDGTRVVTTGSDGTARAWATETGEEMAVLAGHEDSVWTAAFSRDGARIVTTSADRTARVWVTESGEEIEVLAGHAAWINSAAFSPDGTRVVTSGCDETHSLGFCVNGSARVWATETGEALMVLAGHADWVNSAVFSPDGSRILTASCDETVNFDCAAGTAREWDAETGEEVAVLTGHEVEVWSAAFSPDGDWIVTTGCDEVDEFRYCVNNTARVWAADGREALAVLAGYEDWITSAAFSPDGARILSVGCFIDDSLIQCANNVARVWSTDTGQSLAALTGHEDRINSAAFSPDGAWIVTASDDGTARVWATETGAMQALLAGHESSVLSADISPDGAWTVTASKDGTARVWATDTGEEVAILADHVDWVYSAVFSRDGTRIVTASELGTFRVWETETGEEVVALDGNTSAVTSAAFSPDGERIVTVDRRSTVLLWELETGAERALLPQHEERVTTVAFSPDGARIVTASEDRKARVWETETGEEVAILVGHSDVVNSAAFSPDGARIVTASKDGTARVWATETGELQVVLAGHEHFVNSAAFSQDGSRIVTAGSDGTTRVWPAYTMFESIARQRLGSRAFTEEECGRFFPADERELCPQTSEDLFALFDDPVPD